MQRLINRGLNFSILPSKLDITQTLAEFRKYERGIIWHEFHHGKGDTNEFKLKEHIFKEEKTNMPTKYSVPDGLKTFLGSIKSEIQDPRNRNSTESNLPNDEQQALKELIQLQKDRKIVIKACDKGAGVIILNFNDYMKICYEHLTSKQSEGKPYYSEVDDIALDIAKNKIKHALDKALEREIISKTEYTAMIADDKEAGRFYCNLKVHEPHKETPPPRPLISGCNSITENIATYVNYHIGEEATKHDTFLQDTPDFLRIIDRINHGAALNPSTIIFTMDVTSLYTNIIHTEGLKSLERILEKRTNPKVETAFLIELMEIILKENIFQFHNQLWKQQIGAAMGSRPVPHYANIFMAEIDVKIKEIAQKYDKNDGEALRLLKRFLDDYFSLFIGSTRELHKMIDEINLINPTIQLTLNHTSNINETPEERCNCQFQSAIPFLDTLVSLKEGKIEIDLYKKETDRNQYLLPSSCHNKTVTNSIPFSPTQKTEKNVFRNLNSSFFTGPKKKV